MTDTLRDFKDRLWQAYQSVIGELNDLPEDEDEVEEVDFN